MLKTFFLSLSFVLLLFPAFAQVNILFVPEIYGRNVNGLLSCKIISPNQRFNASLTVTVTERQAGTVCVLKTPEFSIAPGSNSVPVTAARSANIRFADSKLARLTSQSQNFLAGDYDYCFELTVRNTDNAPLEQCYSYSLAPFTELNLSTPFNKDTLCDKRPLMTWQPLIPMINGAYYQLVLTEIKAGQNATEALNYNLPIINQHGVSAPALPYPSIARELQQGKKYAWQVTAYKDLTVLNRSEVWEFAVDCKDTLAKRQEADNGYREVEDLANGNYYVAHGKLKFIVVNSYEAQDLDYRILPVLSNGAKIRKLPKIKLIYGKNKVAIDLDAAGGLVAGQFYILDILLPNGERKSVRFQYEKSENGN